MKAAERPAMVSGSPDRELLHVVPLCSLPAGPGWLLSVPWVLRIPIWGAGPAGPVGGIPLRVIPSHPLHWGSGVCPSSPYPRGIGALRMSCGRFPQEFINVYNDLAPRLRKWLRMVKQGVIMEILKYLKMFGSVNPYTLIGVFNFNDEQAKQLYDSSREQIEKGLLIEHVSGGGFVTWKLPDVTEVHEEHRKHLQELADLYKPTRGFTAAQLVEDQEVIGNLPKMTKAQVERVMQDWLLDGKIVSSSRHSYMGKFYNRYVTVGNRARTPEEAIRECLSNGAIMSVPELVAQTEFTTYTIKQRLGVMKDNAEVSVMGTGKWFLV